MKTTSPISLCYDVTVKLQLPSVLSLGVKEKRKKENSTVRELYSSLKLDLVFEKPFDVVFI
jgi:hypothetical protein